MRYKVEISYVGTRYHGSQIQNNALTIQEEIEKVLFVILKKRITIVLCSRTDAGVHALSQVFHFDFEKVDSYKLQGSINALLPDDIYVKKIEEVSNDFHARYSCISKRYKYLIQTNTYDPFLKNRALQLSYKLDIDNMIKCTKIFIGQHDFSSFNTSTYDEKPNQIRNIYDIKITSYNNLIEIEIEADGFLRNMVRIIVGALIDVSRGKTSLNNIKQLLDIPSKSTKMNNVDACGLYLKEITYK